RPPSASRAMSQRGGTPPADQWILSQIPEPGVMALRFDLREPTARYIEYRHDDDKHEIVHEVEVECPRDTNHDQLEEDEHEAARDQIACKRACVRELPAIQKRACARKEHERWGAEVGDPPCEEDACGRAAGGLSGIHADVIDRHQHHHQSGGACW